MVVLRPSSILLASIALIPFFSKRRRVDEALYPLDEVVVISFLRLGPFNQVPRPRVLIVFSLASSLPECCYSLGSSQMTCFAYLVHESGV